MSPKQVELILELVKTAGPIIAMIPALGSRWLKNRDEVQGLIDEGRDPTPEEHARLTRELAGLNTALATAIETATNQKDEKEE